MTRCRHTHTEVIETDGKATGSRLVRCPDKGRWLIRGDWYCEAHARLRWGWQIAALFWPRDGADRDGATVAPWALDALADAVARRTPAAAGLFDGGAVTG